MRARPLSPHLSIYRFAYTMALSITHRITGLALAAGLIVMACTLMAAATGESAYDQAVVILGSWIGKLVLLLWLAAFLYHLANGIRHLVWDTGRALERPQARASATIVVVVAVLAWLVFAWLLVGRSAP